MAYGYIRVIDGDSVLSGGIVEAHRGIGLGEQLFTNLIRIGINMGKKVILEVLKTNSNALGLYKKLGFVPVDEENGVISMYYKTL